MGGIDVDAIAHVADLVAEDACALHREQVNAVAAILRAHAGVAVDAVAAHLGLHGAIEKHAESRALHAVVADGCTLGLRQDEHGRVHGGEVASPIAQRAAFDLHITGGDGQHVALALGIEHRAWLADELQRLVDAELSGIFTGRQTPALFAHGLQRQVADRLRCRLGEPGQQGQRASGDQLKRMRRLISEHDVYLLQRSGRNSGRALPQGRARDRYSEPAPGQRGRPRHQAGSTSMRPTISMCSAWQNQLQ